MKKVSCLFSRRVIIALILAFPLLPTAKAQIVTRYLGSGTIEKFGIKELIATDQLPTFRLPDVDLSALLKEDSINSLRGKPMLIRGSYTDRLQLNITLILKSFGQTFYQVLELSFRLQLLRLVSNLTNFILLRRFTAIQLHFLDMDQGPGVNVI